MHKMNSIQYTYIIIHAQSLAGNVEVNFHEVDRTTEKAGVQHIPKPWNHMTSNHYDIAAAQNKIEKSQTSFQIVIEMDINRYW